MIEQNDNCPAIELLLDKCYRIVHFGIDSISKSNPIRLPENPDCSLAAPNRLRSWFLSGSTVIIFYQLWVENRNCHSKNDYVFMDHSNIIATSDHTFTIVFFGDVVCFLFWKLFQFVFRLCEASNWCLDDVESLFKCFWICFSPLNTKHRFWKFL